MSRSLGFGSDDVESAKRTGAGLAPEEREPADPRAPGAIVIGGDYRGLGIVRSLGRRGIPVWVISDEHVIAAVSRYARRRLRWPGDDDGQRIAFLLDLTEQHRLDRWVLFPTGDESSALLSRHHAALSERFVLTVPPWDVLRWTYDKRLTYQLGDELGVDCPWTSYPGDRRAVESGDYPFPVILKPAYKQGHNALTYAKAWQVEDRAELLSRYDEACQLVDPAVIMIQELLPRSGRDQFSYAALCADGRPLASIVARRTRQYPITFGQSSSYVETVDRPEIEEPSRRILAAMRFTGLIEVEFKRDPRDGRYKLLDINPRVWGWHTLGRRAGVDFPWLYWRVLHGEAMPETRARSGVRWVRATTDVPAVVAEIRLHQLSVRQYLASLRGPIEFAILAPDDPVPGLLEVPFLVRLFLKRWLAQRPSPASREAHAGGGSWR